MTPLDKVSAENRPHVCHQTKRRPSLGVPGLSLTHRYSPAPHVARHQWTARGGHCGPNTTTPLSQPLTPCHPATGSKPSLVPQVAKSTISKTIVSTETCTTGMASVSLGVISAARTKRRAASISTLKTFATSSNHVHRRVDYADSTAPLAITGRRSWPAHMRHPWTASRPALSTAS